jgi:DNA-binding beta-propeller fold protein YncE
MPAPYHLASIGDSGKLYVTSADQPEILVINATDLTLVGKISIGGKGHQLAQSSGN